MELLFSTLFVNTFRSLINKKVCNLFPIRRVEKIVSRVDFLKENIWVYGGWKMYLEQIQQPTLSICYRTKIAECLNQIVYPNSFKAFNMLPRKGLSQICDILGSLEEHLIGEDSMIIRVSTCQERNEKCISSSREFWYDSRHQHSMIQYSVQIGCGVS